MLFCATPCFHIKYTQNRASKVSTPVISANVNISGILCFIWHIFCVYCRAFVLGCISLFRCFLFNDSKNPLHSFWTLQSDWSWRGVATLGLRNSPAFLLCVSWSCCRCCRSVCEEEDEEEHRLSTRAERESTNNLHHHPAGLIKHCVTVNTRGLFCHDNMTGLLCFVIKWQISELEMDCSTAKMDSDSWILYFMWYLYTFDVDFISDFHCKLLKCVIFPQ